MHARYRQPPAAVARRRSAPPVPARPRPAPGRRNRAGGGHRRGRRLTRARRRRRRRRRHARDAPRVAAASLESTGRLGPCEARGARAGGRVTVAGADRPLPGGRASSHAPASRRVYTLRRPTGATTSTCPVPCPREPIAEAARKAPSACRSASDWRCSLLLWLAVRTALRARRRSARCATSPRASSGLPPASPLGRRRAGAPPRSPPSAARLDSTWRRASPSSSRRPPPTRSPASATAALPGLRSRPSSSARPARARRSRSC